MYPCDNPYNYTFAVYPTDTLLYVVDGKEIKGKKLLSKKVLK